MDETARVKQQVQILYESEDEKSMASAIREAIETLAGKYQTPELVYWCRGHGYNPESLDSKPVIFVGWEEVRYRENPMPKGAKVIVYVHNYGERIKVVVFANGEIDRSDYNSIKDAAEQIAMTVYHYGIYEPTQPVQPEKPELAK